MFYFSPKLSRVEPAPGGEPGSFLTYGYDAAGDRTAVEQAGAECSGRTSFLDHQNTRKGPGDGGSATHPVIKHTTSLFYFAGRPVAQLRQFQAGGGADELLFITTDHLGVPILATDRFGTQVWAGGLDPFGEPFAFPRTEPPDDEEPPPPPPGEELTANSCEPEEPGGPQGLIPLENAGLFLRFPGQWDDPSFQSHGLRGGLYYNVHRWYGTSAGRYAQGDRFLPISWKDSNPFTYSRGRPVVFTDPLGLFTIDPSCDCPPNVPWRPAENIPKAMARRVISVATRSAKRFFRNTSFGLACRTGLDRMKWAVHHTSCARRILPAILPAVNSRCRSETSLQRFIFTRVLRPVRATRTILAYRLPYSTKSFIVAGRS